LPGIPAALGKQRFSGHFDLRYAMETLKDTESVAIARRRYLGGLASYYEVLEAQ
jgi:hypothetical protein